MERLASSRGAHVALLSLTGIFAIVAVEYSFQLSETLRHAFNVGVYNNLMLGAGLVCVARAIRYRQERLAWSLVGAAVLAWGIGNTVWVFTVANLDDPPFPSYADIGFLAVYPPAYVAIVLLLRSRVGQLPLSLWLDGLIGGLAVAAVGTAVVFEAVLDAVGGSRAAVATNLAYPLADLALIALVVWALAATGWRPGRTWGLIAAGLLVFSVSDCLYLYQTAVGSYVYGSPTDLGWVTGGLLLAWAAWQPAGERVRRTIDGWLLFVAPVSLSILGLAVLVYDHFHRVNPLALVFASLSILAVVARMALTFHENMRIIERTRHEADTDALTGLLNHRRLLVDLEHALDPGAARSVVAVFDLNGFKQYNDTFGHPAGDELLARLANRLAHVVSGRGTAYRLGGDEFCVIFERQAGQGGFVLAGAARALSEHGDGFAIAASVGAALLPDEARTATEALRLADQRMYAHKQRDGGPSVTKVGSVGSTPPALAAS
jgi:diguanylate cyclase (GGDEF)-like protein